MKNLPVVLFNMSIRMHVGYEAPGFEGRRCRLQGSKVRASCPLGIIPKTLGDSSFTPKGMPCVTYR